MASLVANSDRFGPGQETAKRHCEREAVRTPATLCGANRMIRSFRRVTISIVRSVSDDSPPASLCTAKSTKEFASRRALLTFGWAVAIRRVASVSFVRRRAPKGSAEQI
jgi:hypothetical protein